MSTLEVQSPMMRKLLAPGVGYHGRAVRRNARKEHLSNVLTVEQWQAIAWRLQLTPRQLQITRSIFDGLEERGVAQRLGISPHTVHAHINRIYMRQEVSSHSELLVKVFLAHLQEIAQQPALETDSSGEPVKAFGRLIMGGYD